MDLDSIDVPKKKKKRKYRGYKKGFKRKRNVIILKSE